MSVTNFSEYADNTSTKQRKYKQAMDVAALFLIVLAVHFVVAAFSGSWPWSSNSYNSYLLQTLSWLEGRLDLGQNYEWLELAIYNGKYFVSFPPFPSTGCRATVTDTAVILTSRRFSLNGSAV